MGVNIQWTRGGVFASSQFYLIAPAHSDFRYREYRQRRVEAAAAGLVFVDAEYRYFQKPFMAQTHSTEQRYTLAHTYRGYTIILPEVIKCFLFKALMNMAYLSSARILCTHLEYSTCSRALVNFAFYARVHIHIFCIYIFMLLVSCRQCAYALEKSKYSCVCCWVYAI